VSLPVCRLSATIEFQMNTSLKSLSGSFDRKEILVPCLKKFLARENAQVISGKLTSKDIVVHDADMTVACFTARKKHYNHQTEPEGEFFHPSRLGACMRQVAFGAFRADSDEAKTGEGLLREAMVFEMGTYVHVLFQNLCERAGILESREVAICRKDLKILGHADGIVCIDGIRYLLEIKTINTRGFTLLTEAKPEHVKQIHAYMRALRLKSAIVVYFDKDRNTLKEFVVRFNHAYYLSNVKRRIRQFFKCIRRRLLPAREAEDPHRFPCSFCAYSRLCWSTDHLKKWMSQNKVKHYVPKNPHLYD